MKWQEKINQLVTLAKAVGRYTHVETDGYQEARQRLFDVYEAFCQWRHDEPYVVDEITELLDTLRKQKDYAYYERNQLVAALSKLFPSWLERHPDSDTTWENDWRTIVYIMIPTRVVWGDGRNHVPEDRQYAPRQLSWHIHDSEVKYFSHLQMREGNSWDFHTNEEKYERLRNIRVKR